MNPGRVSFFRCLAPLCLAGLVGCAARSLPNEPDPPWPVPVDAALSGLTLFDGWQSPHALPPPVNSPGCQDSSFISPDGSTLYFAYTQKRCGIPGGQPQIYDGAARPGAVGRDWNVYEATVVDDAWSVIDSTVNVDPTVSQGAEGVDDSNTQMVLARVGSAKGDLYFSTKQDGVWGAEVRLDAPLSTDCYEDNPALSGDGQRLYFDSNRADAAGTTCKPSAEGPTRDLYVATRIEGGWSAPVLVAGAPNEGDLHWQGYEHGDDFYWTGHDARCGGALACIYRARRQPDGSYADSTVIVQPTDFSSTATGDVFGIGEVSLTADSHWMYFVYGMTTSSGPDLNFLIGVAWHP